MNTCPYCDANAQRDTAWYFRCENGHTFHIDDWDDALGRGVTA